MGSVLRQNDMIERQMKNTDVIPMSCVSVGRHDYSIVKVVVIVIVMVCVFWF